ncbi:hypothetical protein H0H87_008658 [Tephrocybe sp. NHM501043]|nr:hypothetical protein H0H87_008658 [Tephrocybe sp. NHM501043]
MFFECRFERAEKHATKAPIAHKYKINKITPALIAYTAAQQKKIIIAPSSKSHSDITMLRKAQAVALEEHLRTQQKNNDLTGSNEGDENDGNDGHCKKGKGKAKVKSMDGSGSKGSGDEGSNDEDKGKGKDKGKDENKDENKGREDKNKGGEDEDKGGEDEK